MQIFRSESRYYMCPWMEKYGQKCRGPSFDSWWNCQWCERYGLKCRSLCNRLWFYYWKTWRAVVWHGHYWTPLSLLVHCTLPFLHLAMAPVVAPCRITIEDCTVAHFAANTSRHFGSWIRLFRNWIFVQTIPKIPAAFRRNSHLHWFYHRGTFARNWYTINSEEMMIVHLNEMSDSHRGYLIYMFKSWDCNMPNLNSHHKDVVVLNNFSKQTSIL